MAPTAAASRTASIAKNPGTFIYESGTDQDVQVRVGLFGALVVRPTAGIDHANNRPDSLFTTRANTGNYVRNDEEFLMLLSEVDPYLNQSVELNVNKTFAQSKKFNMTTYHPRYWLVNGRGFPDSIADNYASWLPNQPYGSLARVKEKDSVKHPNPGLVRYINVGTEDYPFHPHGNNGKVIARDGHPLEGPNGEDLSYEKFSLDIGPGQTWDVLFEWFDAEHYDKDHEPRSCHGAAGGQPGVRHVLQRQPLLGRHDRPNATGQPEPEPVRRVLHHRSQPRSVPDHVVGREHDRPHHLHAYRSFRYQQLPVTTEAEKTMTRSSAMTTNHSHRTGRLVALAAALAALSAPIVSVAASQAVSAQPSPQTTRPTAASPAAATPRPTDGSPLAGDPAHHRPVRSGGNHDDAERRRGYRVGLRARRLLGSIDDHQARWPGDR